jgi:hypothetical protein
LVENTDAAKEFVPKRVAEGSDYIKVVCDIPGPEQDVVNAVIEEAHRHGKMVIAHAATLAPFEMAQIAKIDMITYIFLDNTLPKGCVDRMVVDKCISIPTLSMMEGVAKVRQKKIRTCTRFCHRCAQGWSTCSCWNGC